MANLVLVVDDDADVREFLTMVLTAEGYAVATAADGPSALTLALRERPACILLDVMLPELSGLEVLAQLRSQGLAARVILMTAMHLVPDAATALGARALLRKPFDLAGLLAAVADVT